jgi:hypothetical protein
VLSAFLAISAVLCSMPSLPPGACDRIEIQRPEDFPGGWEAHRGHLTVTPGKGMRAQVTSGGASYARGIVSFRRRGGPLGAGRRFELAGRFRFDAGGYVSVMRADDYATSGADAIQLGVERQAGDRRLHIAARRYDGQWTGFDVASSLAPVPDREYALRLRVTIGSDPGAAVTELWARRRLIASTTMPNIRPGRAFTKARVGVVAVADSPVALRMRHLEVLIDRAAALWQLLAGARALE